MASGRACVTTVAIAIATLMSFLALPEAARAQDVIGDWANIKAPPPPETEDCHGRTEHDRALAARFCASDLRSAKETSLCRVAAGDEKTSSRGANKSTSWSSTARPEHHNRQGHLGRYCANAGRAGRQLARQQISRYRPGKNPERQGHQDGHRHRHVNVERRGALHRERSGVPGI